MRTWKIWTLAIALALGSCLTPSAALQAQTPDPFTLPDQGKSSPIPQNTMDEVRHAIIRLPLAAGLAVLLAVRPRRKGTPPRQPAVIQTQIILGIVGAVVMLVVGTNLARAFGVVIGIVASHRPSFNNLRLRGTFLRQLCRDS